MIKIIEMLPHNISMPNKITTLSFVSSIPIVFWSINIWISEIKPKTIDTISVNRVRLYLMLFLF